MELKIFLRQIFFISVQVLDHFCDDTGTKAKKFVEKPRLKTTMDTLR